MNWRYYIDAALHHLRLSETRLGWRFCNYYERWLTK